MGFFYRSAADASMPTMLTQGCIADPIVCIHGWRGNLPRTLADLSPWMGCFHAILSSLFAEAAWVRV